MQIVIMATGTRGDVQPIIALAKALQAVGHQVRLIAGANFGSWIEAHGLEVFPTINMTELMQSELGIKWVESSNGFAQLRAMKALTDDMLDHIVDDTINGTQDAELLLGGFTAEPYLQAISEKYSIPLVTIALQPYRPTRVGAASLLPLLPRSHNIANRWSGVLAERLTWWVAQATTNALRARLKLATHTGSSYRRSAKTIPALYAMSPHVVPPVTDTLVHSTGFWFLDEGETPSPELLRFLATGPAPVYIGFGSMSSSDPARTMQVVADALAQAGQRGVLARGWSGANVAEIPDHVYLLDNAAHSWLFPRMVAVVHHGGAGTTAAGLRAGKPTLIVPHMADQPFWGRRVYELGVGVKPIPRAQLTTGNLAQRLHTLLTNADIRAKAAVLGEQIRAERGVEEAITWLDAFISKRPAQSYVTLPTTIKN